MGFILMLLTMVFLVAAFFVLIFALIAGKSRLRNFILLGILVWLFLYAVLLVGFSLRSRQTYLPQKWTKSFCGFYPGCHLKASVTNVRTAEEIGGVKAQGVFYIVTVRIQNDSEEKSLSMIAPEATVIDEGPRLYSRIEAAEKQLPLGASAPFDQPVPAGGSFEKEIVFDLTEPAKTLKMSFTDTHGLNHLLEAFLITDEESLFHQPILFIIKSDSTS